MENKVVEQAIEEAPHLAKYIRDAANGRLASFIDRIERLEEEKKELSADIREIFAEAKGSGYDIKVMRQILRLRKMTPADRAEAEYLRDEYKKFLGI